VTAGVGRLRDRVRGQVVTADDSEYDEARKVYNAMIDRRPHAVVRCATRDDVAAAVDYGRESGLAVAVRGGGHSVPGFGTADDAVVVDLSALRQVTVDPAARTARAEGSCTWGVFNEATHAHGLATTGGIISTPG
jgi:FAD/FMN-containing dehydrogenase